MILQNFYRTVQACCLLLALASAGAVSAQNLLLNIDRTPTRVVVNLLNDQALPGRTQVLASNSILLRVPTGTNITGFSSPAAAGFSISTPPAGSCTVPGLDYYILTPAPNGALIPDGTTLAANSSSELFSFDLPMSPICLGDISIADPATDPCVFGSANALPSAQFLSRIQLTGAVGVLTSSGNDRSQVPCDPNSPVPVELSHFKATAVEETSVLDWRTASEINNAGYEVQRNTLGSDWVTIGWVDGNGTKQSASDYAFVDESPLNGVNYYRLRQLDFDGSKSFSGIVSTRFAKTTDVEVYPNPSQGNFHVDLPEVPTGELLFRVADVNGRLIHQEKIVDPGFATYDLELDFLPSGTYQLDIVSSLGQATERIVILEY